MKKITFFIIILAAIVVFAAADYLINKPAIESGGMTSENSQEISKELNLIESLPAKFGYIPEKRDRTKQIFEKFDLSTVNDIKIYRNLLSKNGSEPIIIYEIQVPEKGSLTYLNIKLKLIEQLGGDENINETNEYGTNSLFYNNSNNVNTGFLLTKIENNLFGFQYSKQDESFTTVKNMIGELMLL